MVEASTGITSLLLGRICFLHWCKTPCVVGRLHGNGGGGVADLKWQTLWNLSINWGEGGLGGRNSPGKGPCHPLQPHPPGVREKEGSLLVGQRHTFHSSTHPLALLEAFVHMLSMVQFRLGTAIGVPPSPGSVQCDWAGHCPSTPELHHWPTGLAWTKLTYISTANFNNTIRVRTWPISLQRFKKI